MLQALIYSLVISYAAAALAPVPAPATCTTNADCARDQCCYSDIQIASKKRDVASILPITNFGTCQDYQQEGHFCGGSGCGCAPGLYCDQLLVASRAAEENDTSELSSSRLIAPINQGICRARSIIPDPPCGGQQCTRDSDCVNGCCFYNYPVLSKRLVIAPISGECRPYQGYGEQCYGDCGCEPGLVCNYVLPPIGVVSRAVAADSDALIAPLPGSCRYTSASVDPVPLSLDEDDK